MIDIPCVILAGGKSSRMKRDKALLPFGGYKTLCEFQYEKLKNIFKDVFVSSKENKFAFRAKYIYDENETFAPIVAIEKALERFDRVFIIGVDLPFVKNEDIIKLISLNGCDVATMKNGSNIEPLVAVYDEKLKDRLKSSIYKKEFKLKDVILNSNYKTLEVQKSSLVNLNTPSEYEEARKIHG